MLGRKFELFIQNQLNQGPLSIYKNQLFSVGGFVRDQIIGRESLDIDLMVTIDGGAEKLGQFFKNYFHDQITTPIQMGAVYPIWSFEFKTGEFEGLKIDIADSQKEMFPKNDQRSRVTSFGTFNEDIERRDFTVNMLARNLTIDQIIDQSQTGLNDLQNKILRTHPNVDAEKILSDDPLRKVRAVRFACTHGFKMDDQLFRKIQINAQRIQIVSGERLIQELEKIIEAGQFARAVSLFLDLKMMRFIFNEAVEKLFQDEKMKAQILQCLQVLRADTALQLAGLLYFLNPNDLAIILEKLKISQTIKRSIVGQIQHVEKLLTVDVTSFLDVRHFARFCDFQIDDLVALAEVISTDFKSSEFLQTFKKVCLVPIYRKPILDGKEISELLQISGAEIKKAQELLFKIEDEYVMDHQAAITKEQAQQKLMSRFKVFEQI